MKKIHLTINGHTVDTRRHRMAYVSINGATIRRNAVKGSDDPPIRIARSQSDSKPTYAHEIAIDGPSRLIYSPDCPIMKCGARLVLIAPAEYVKVRR